MSFGADDGRPYGREGDENPLVKQNRVAAAHGVVMGLAFLILFPLGAMAMRIPGLKGAFGVHIGTQLFAYITAIIGLGLGIWLANNTRTVRLLDFHEFLPSSTSTCADRPRSHTQFNSDNHPPLGVAIIVLLLFQPPLGYMHHRVFVQKRRSSIWTYAHMWYGRVLIALGIIEGFTGLGLASDVANQLPSSIRSGKIAWGILAAMTVVLYVGVVLMALFRRRKVGTGDVPLQERTANKPF
ncbi:MAG: hypothetical protein LQ347_002717 [Umbilicaria vellea]|nr:MAG: hypothetical protein LQ347_002717 [Umbilicaria vellea]